MGAMEHVSPEELQAGLDEVRRSPSDVGTVELIVRRPAENEREVSPRASSTSSGASSGMRG